MILPHVSSLSTQIYPGGIWGIGCNPVNCSFLSFLHYLHSQWSFQVFQSTRPCMLLIYQYIITWSVCESYSQSSRNIDGINHGSKPWFWISPFRCCIWSSFWWKRRRISWFLVGELLWQIITQSKPPKDRPGSQPTHQLPVKRDL